MARDEIEAILDKGAACDAVAQRFHEHYEALAPSFGYQTRSESAVPWDDVPEDNRWLMAATVGAVLDDPDSLIALTADYEAEVERLRAALREVAQNACVWDRDAITAALAVLGETE